MVIIKIGGTVATNETVLHALLKEIAELQNSDSFVLVHGGGKEVTSFSEKLGLQSEFQNGIRVTSPEEMDVVDMILGGRVNIALVRVAQTLGLDAVGLGGQDGKLFVSQAMEFPGKPNCRTGHVTKADARLVTTLTDAGYFPIVHSTSCDTAGKGLNINADEAAQEVAIAAKAATLLYVSDIPGVLKNSVVLPKLDEKTIKEEISAGVISGGMIPKVENALSALKRGVGKLIIGGFQNSGDLKRLLAGTNGTTISL